MRGERLRMGGPWAHRHGERPFGPGPRPGRGGRMRRGEIRTAVLSVLTDGPAHGYEIIQTLEERTGGMWRPSPGSVYPTLQMLEDEGLVQATERDGKRVFELTDAGREEAETRLRGAGDQPWQLGERGLPHAQLRLATARLQMAAKQVTMTATPEQIERATEIITAARRELYQLLAED